MDARNALGTAGVWGGVGFTGQPFAAASGSYHGIDAQGRVWTSAADSGSIPANVGNLRPLVLAALYETAFASEAGPLSTWSN